MGIISSIFVGLGAAVLVKVSTVGVVMGLFLFFDLHEKNKGNSDNCLLEKG